MERGKKTMVGIANNEIRIFTRSMKVILPIELRQLELGNAVCSS